MSQVKTQSQIKTQSQAVKDMTYIALFSVIIAICSWISIPTVVPFTLQTFAIFCALGLLGGKKGTVSILLYILLGAIGVPVFANFSGGLGIILGSTGGYIIGFLFAGLVYWGITHCFGEKAVVMIGAMVIGQIVCFVFGTMWFMIVYSRSVSPIDLTTALGWCVTPFIVPDVIKIGLASLITKRLAPYVKL